MANRVPMVIGFMGFALASQTLPQAEHLLRAALLSLSLGAGWAVVFWRGTPPQRRQWSWGATFWPEGARRFLRLRRARYVELVVWALFLFSPVPQVQEVRTLIKFGLFAVIAVTAVLFLRVASALLERGEIVPNEN